MAVNTCFSQAPLSMATWSSSDDAFAYRDFAKKTVKIEGKPMVIDESISYFSSRKLDFEVSGQTINSGIIRGRDNAGNLRFESLYSRNTLYGPTRTLHSNGVTRDSGLLIMNMPDGQWSFYYPDGTLKSKRNYNAYMWWELKWSIEHGNPYWNRFELSEWYSKRPGYFYNYVNAESTFGDKYSPPFYYCVQHGKVVNYHANGIVSDSVEYFKGLPDGIWFSYYDNGVLKELGSYKLGEKHGRWKTQYPSGNLSNLKVYKNGKVVELKEFED